MENWFLIIIMVVVGLLTMASSVYLLIAFQHPEDRNQAWFPKIVVCLGICLAIWTVLLFPLDVANVHACSADLPLADCSTTLPMDILWYAVYVAIVVMAFAVIPFALFYYEGDSEWSMGRRILSAVLWSIGTFICIVLIIVIPYVTIGYVKYPVQSAWSGMLPVSYTSSATMNTCIGLFADYNVNAPSGPPAVNNTIAFVGINCNTLSNGLSEMWTLRTSFIMYVMAMVSTIGWFLFMVFGAVGLVSLPLDFIREFLGRPRKVITRSQYIERAADLGRRAQEIKLIAEVLQKEERERGRSWKWRRNTRALGNQMIVLEEDAVQLELVYPQGEDPEYKWVWMIMKYWLKLVVGILSIGVTISWILQIILYILISPPVSPLLNTAFTKADAVFPLFGTLLFALWAFYLQAAVIKGNFKFGLNLLLFRVHPMRRGATFMSSFLFNIALLLLASTAAVQFCSEAFALYAENSDILNIFGAQLTSLQGLSWLYNNSIFIYILLGMTLLTLIYLCVRGPDRWKREKPEGVYEM
ncbi:hypothetical protein ACKKBG_A18505 [Auxenochlorella protothecoides x Auxenochlorella symbiontica]